MTITVQVSWTSWRFASKERRIEKWTNGSRGCVKEEIIYIYIYIGERIVRILRKGEE